MSARRRRRRLLPGTATIALLFVTGVVTGCAGQAPPRQLGGIASLTSRFAGIPQHGASLGSPDAPYTLVEFVDMQCPFSARFQRDVLPTLLRRFIRSGRLRIELRTVAFLGPDSAPLAAATAAAGMQDRMWQFADLAFRNQGRENSGYATPAFIGTVAKAVPDLDIGRLQRTSGTPALRRALQSDARSAKTAAITGTPAFRLGPTGGVLAPFGHGPVDRRAFVQRLARALV